MSKRINFLICLFQAFFALDALTNELKIDAHFSGISVGNHLVPLNPDVKNNADDLSSNTSQKISINTGIYTFHNANEKTIYSLNVENVSRQKINLVMFSNLPLSVLTAKKMLDFGIKGKGESFVLIDSSYKELIPSVLLRVDPGKNVFQVEMQKFGGFGPSRMYLWTEKEFSLYEKEVLIYISLVFGAVTSLLLYNIFLLSVNKSQNTFYFTVTCLFLGLFEAVVSGVNTIFNENVYIYTSKLWPLFAVLAATFFALYFKETNVTSKKKLSDKIFYIVVTCANLIALVCLIFSDKIGHQTQLFAVFAAAAFTGVLPYIIGKYKVIDHLLFMSSMPMVLASLAFILQVTNKIDIEYDFLRIQLIASVLFLLCLSIYTGNKTHKERLEKVKLQEMITLGRNVQDLLLPKRLEGKSDRISYMFAYEPFEGKMSGDWIKYWRTKNGNQHFLLGDVTGKGPQAALTVSIITTVVDRCIRLDFDSKAALIQINKTIFNLLKGNVGSTASGATIMVEGDILLYNTAGIGWVVQSKNKSRHVLGRSGILGQKSFVDIYEEKVLSKNWQSIYTFSDGVCNGPRAVKHLARHLKEIDAETIETPILRAEVLRVSQTVGDPQDDKTFLFVKADFNQVSGL